MHAALAAGDWPRGLRLQELLLPIVDYRARAGDSYNIAMLKHAMRVVGNDFGEPRPPGQRLTPDERAEIERLLRPILDAEAGLS